jgi:hypothetical protein
MIMTSDDELQAFGILDEHPSLASRFFQDSRPVRGRFVQHVGAFATRLPAMTKAW